MNTILKKYFSFESNIFFEPKDLMDNLNEEFVLEGEEYLSKEGIDNSNIYLKFLALKYLNEAIALENDNTQLIKYKELIAMIREEL